MHGVHKENEKNPNMRMHIAHFDTTRKENCSRWSVWMRKVMPCISIHDSAQWVLNGVECNRSLPCYFHSIFYSLFFFFGWSALPTFISQHTFLIVFALLAGCLFFVFASCIFSWITDSYGDKADVRLAAYALRTAQEEVFRFHIPIGRGKRERERKKWRKGNDLCFDICCWLFKFYFHFPVCMHLLSPPSLPLHRAHGMLFQMLA